MTAIKKEIRCIFMVYLKNGEINMDIVNFNQVIDGDTIIKYSGKAYIVPDRYIKKGRTDFVFIKGVATPVSFVKGSPEKVTADELYNAMENKTTRYFDALLTQSTSFKKLVRAVTRGLVRIFRIKMTNIFDYSTLHLPSGIDDVEEFGKACNSVADSLFVQSGLSQIFNKEFFARTGINLEEGD